MRAISDRVLIVAECNVNKIFNCHCPIIFYVLIVAECNVNHTVCPHFYFLVIVLIVAECNVNFCFFALVF